jgi:hypothetical protein
MTEMQPTEAEVLQEEPTPELATVPVRVVAVDAPVRIQSLPTKTLSTQTRILVDAGVRLRVLTADPYRAQAVLIADAPFYFASLLTGVDDNLSSSWWPANVPLPITAVSAVWIRSTLDDLTISITTERWATGSTHADD